MTAIRTPEFTEVIAGTPDFLISSVKTAPDWLPKVIPHVYHGSEHHEGDGGEGTKTTYHLHENHAAGGGFLGMKTHIEAFDEANHSYICDMEGDPRYSLLKFYVTFLPGPSDGTSVVKWSMDYTPVNDDTPAPDHLVATVPLIFKDVAAHHQFPTSENPKP